jgi:acetone carboxylase gamma subunit
VICLDQETHFIDKVVKAIIDNVKYDDTIRLPVAKSHSWGAQEANSFVNKVL